MTIANGKKVVEIAQNVETWIACYFVDGSAVRSRSFKTLAGAQRWAKAQVGA